MTGIVLGMLFLAVAAAYAQGDDFVYDDHGRRDPFGPLVTSVGEVVVSDTDLTAADMNVQGLVVDPQGNNLAIINGKIVKAGDHVGPYKVDAVAVDHVELLKEQEHITLRLKKGGT